MIRYLMVIGTVILLAWGAKHLDESTQDYAVFKAKGEKWVLQAQGIFEIGGYVPLFLSFMAIGAGAGIAIGISIGRTADRKDFIKKVTSAEGYAEEMQSDRDRARSKAEQAFEHKNRALAEAQKQLDVERYQIIEKTNQAEAEIKRVSMVEQALIKENNSLRKRATNAICTAERIKRKATNLNV